LAWKLKLWFFCILWKHGFKHSIMLANKKKEMGSPYRIPRLAFIMVV
jgi:hypothetical protein